VSIVVHEHYPSKIKKRMGECRSNSLKDSSDDILQWEDYWCGDHPEFFTITGEENMDEQVYRRGQEAVEAAVDLWLAEHYDAIQDLHDDLETVIFDTFHNATGEFMDDDEFYCHELRILRDVALKEKLSSEEKEKKD